MGLLSQYSYWSSQRCIYLFFVTTLSLCGFQFQFHDQMKTELVFEEEGRSTIPILRGGSGKGTDVDIKQHDEMSPPFVSSSSWSVFPRVAAMNNNATKPAANQQEWVVFVPSEPISKNSPKLDNFLDASAISEGEDHDIHALDKYAPKQYSVDFQRHCQPMKSWQTQSFPTCNSIHEVVSSNPFELDYLGAGGWRYTFAHLTMTELVIKLFALEDHKDYEYDPRSYEIHRVDALVSERLTASNFIMDIYGHCGLTSLYERGRRSLSEAAVAKKKLDLPTKFLYSYQVSKAVADMHGFDYPTTMNSTVAHRDMKTDNIMIAGDGTAKLNDFNDSILRFWNVTSGTTKCPFYNPKFPLHWGNGYKPVEMSAAGYPPLEDSLDVFGLGGILYYILVGRNPYSDIKDKNERSRAMLAGQLPRIPEEYTTAANSDDGLQTLIRLIQECMVLNPEDRPTAKYVMGQLEPFTKIK